MFGVYVHFPYCRRRCPFCDFAIAVRPQLPHDEYAGAVLAELDARAPWFEGRRAVSLYFGGGTPGLWRADCVARVVLAVRERFGQPREITIECIPGELDAAHARALRHAGVTRLSLGLESLDDAELLALGRAHSVGQGREAVAVARAAGFADLSGDLMFALPGQPVAAWEAQLRAAQTLELSHWSVYQLTVEPRTPFGRLGLRTPEGEEHFLCAHDQLTAAGYVHYEVSSYARPGHQAVHNSLYWRGGEYLGLGMSAHSFRRLPSGAGERWANGRDVKAYLADPCAEPPERETLAPAALAREAAWLWLRRLDEGIPRQAFAELYGVDPALEHAAALERLSAAGLVTVTAEAIRVSRRGMLLVDEIAARLV
jgi:oxygen-independent coproporphyrinogen-3 oxidase